VPPISQQFSAFQKGR